MWFRFFDQRQETRFVESGIDLHEAMQLFEISDQDTVTLKEGLDSADVTRLIKGMLDQLLPESMSAHLARNQVRFNEEDIQFELYCAHSDCMNQRVLIFPISSIKEQNDFIPFVLFDASLPDDEPADGSISSSAVTTPNVSRLDEASSVVTTPNVSRLDHSMHNMSIMMNISTEMELDNSTDDDETNSDDDQDSDLSDIDVQRIQQKVLADSGHITDDISNTNQSDLAVLPEVAEHKASQVCKTQSVDMIRCIVLRNLCYFTQFDRDTHTEQGTQTGDVESNGIRFACVSTDDVSEQKVYD